MRWHTAHRRHAKVERRQARFEAELKAALVSEIAKTFDRMAAQLVGAVVGQQRLALMLTNFAAQAAASRAMLEELWANRIDEAEI